MLSPDEALLTRLRDESSNQETTIPRSRYSSVVEGMQKQDATAKSIAKQDFDGFMVDKFIALEEEDKCLFMYSLLLSTGATTTVEAGTSFGVSTIYLALAVLRNQGLHLNAKKGRVVGTEKEGTKAEVARKFWKEAGPEIEDVIELRVGDLNDTLRKPFGNGDQEGSVDFLLLDSKLICL